MKKLSKGTRNYIAKNERRIQEYSEKAEKALLENNFFECFRYVTNIHKCKDTIRMLKHEAQHNITFDDVWNKWNENKLSYGTKEEYAIWNAQNLNIIMSM